MSTDALSLNGIISLKGLSSAKILKEELPIPTDPVNAPNEEVKKCLLEMSKQIIDFQNDEGGSKKLVVLEKPKENEIEEECEAYAEVDDDTTLATMSLPPIERPGLFDRITSVFGRRRQHFSPSPAHSFAVPTAPVETSKEDVYWTSFESVPDVDEKTLADITNLALRDKTIKKDEETLSKLLKLYIKHGHNNLVRRVLDDMMINSYPVDGTDSDEMTPLTYAMLSNNTEAACLLLNAGADPNRICSLSLKDFIVPFLKNNRELIHELISVIKKPFEESFLQNKEELRKSFEINKDRIIEILSANEDKLKSLDLSKEEILKTLENDIEEGSFHFDLLIDFPPFFLEKILDQWPDRGGEIPVSPINLAILMGNLDIANELINKKADITSSFAGIPFSSPIHLASLLGSDHFVSLLLKNRVDVNLTGPIGETPLITAVLRGKASLVELLLHSNPNVDQLVDLNHLPLSETETVDIKFNALTLALAFGKKEIIKLLENRGAKIEEALKNNTAKVFSLFFNLLRDDKDGFEFLLRGNCDVQFS